MKVLWVTGSFYPTNSGGMDTIMHWIALCIRQQGVDLTLLTTHEEEEAPVRPDRWYETDFGKIKYVSTLFHYFPVRLILAAWKAVISHRYIHLCNIFYPSSIAVATFAVLLRREVLWSVHGELDPWAIQHRSYKKRPFLWFIKTFLYRNVIFHATCPEEVAYIQSAFGKDAKTILIPNYILLPKKETVTSEEKYLLFVGRIHEKKGVDRLIDGLAKSDHFLNSDFSLKIVGDYENDYGQSLVEQVRTLGLDKKVLFLGKKEGAEKFQLFAGAYCSIMPSITENFGMVVVESLSQGTPVIASTGTPWQVLEQEQAGLWVDPEAAPLTAAIDQILTLSPDAYQAMRHQSYQLVCRDFDMNKNIHKWLEVYQNIYA